MRTVSLALSQSCRSVYADAWYKHAPKFISHYRQRLRVRLCLRQCHRQSLKPHSH